MSSSETFDPAIQTENIAFSQEDLVDCGACGRVNPPNRVSCIYCGHGLEVRAEAVNRLAVRELEPWEPGANVVVTSTEGDPDKASSFLAIDREQLRGILDSGVCLPIDRFESKAAEVIAVKLIDAGFKVQVIDDRNLFLSTPPVRLAGMRFGDDRLTVVALNTREQRSHPWSDLRLVVTGSFSIGRVDSTEKRRMRGTTVMSETMTSADETVFDLYCGEDALGYRVQLSGFDYSCLGGDMAPLAAENISRLIDVLSGRSPEMSRVDYKPIRHLLTGIWDINSRKDPKGLQQVGFGKREFAVVHSTSNVEQFTRFSRLQRVLL